MDNAKLLTSNPWHQFDWIEGVDRPIRQFDSAELLSILEYFEKEWPGITVAVLAAKVSLWSWSRLSEFAGLQWENVRVVENEVHLEIHGKANVDKWARIPDGLHQELVAIRTGSPYIFAAYSQQLRDFYIAANGEAYRKVCRKLREEPGLYISRVEEGTGDDRKRRSLWRQFLFG